MTNEPRITLLHLSDLQFGPHHRFEGAGSPGSLLHRLRDDLEKLREEGVRPEIAESHRKEDHYGFLGDKQLRFFAEKLRPHKESGVVRIAAVHHNPRHRRGIVSLDGTRAGIIEETPQGSRFIYDEDYLTRPGAVPISPTLPLQSEPYTSAGLHPFFENLLPEGWLLDQTCRKLHLDPADAFGVMLATCADCAGAVEIVPEAS